MQNLVYLTFLITEICVFKRTYGHGLIDLVSDLESEYMSVYTM